MEARELKNIRCDVCRSLLLDSDWEKTASGDLQRGAFRVYPETGEIEQEGVIVPMWWFERRCVRRAVRLRAEKRFKAYGWVPAGKKK